MIALIDDPKIQRHIESLLSLPDGMREHLLTTTELCAISAREEAAEKQRARQGNVISGPWKGKRA
jgi:hypothetical protein